MNALKLSWQVETSGMFAGRLARADTLIADLSVIMRTDANGRDLGYTLCMFGRMINTGTMDINTAQRNAESAFREFLRDTLGTLR